MLIQFKRPVKYVDCWKVCTDCRRLSSKEVLKYFQNYAVISRDRVVVIMFCRVYNCWLYLGAGGARGRGAGGSGEGATNYILGGGGGLSMSIECHGSS